MKVLTGTVMIIAHQELSFAVPDDFDMGTANDVLMTMFNPIAAEKSVVVEDVNLSDIH